MNAAPAPTAATGTAPELGVVEAEAAAADAEFEPDDRAEEAAEDALERVPRLAEEAAPEPPAAAAEEAEMGELLQSSGGNEGRHVSEWSQALNEAQGEKTDVLVAAAAARVEVVMPAAESLIPHFGRQHRSR